MSTRNSTIILINIFILFYSSLFAVENSTSKYYQKDLPKSLIKYLKKNEIDTLKAAKLKLDNISSSKELFDFYENNLFKLKRIFGSVMKTRSHDSLGTICFCDYDSIVDQFWKSVKNYLPVFNYELSMQYEGLVRVDNQYFFEKSKETPENDDDEYFSQFLKLEQEFPEELYGNFNIGQIDTFILFKQMFNYIKSAKDIHKVYANYLPLLEGYLWIMLDSRRGSAGEIDDSTRNLINRFLPIFDIRYYSEEYGEQIDIDITSIIQKSKITPERIDDEFFEFIKLIYKCPFEPSVVVVGPGGCVNYYTVTCDLCDYSNLGDGIFYKILKASEKALKAGSLFKDEILRERVIPNISRNYGATKIKVLLEIEQILTKCSLTNSEKSQVINVRNKIKTDKTIQFNCEAGNCKY